MYEQMESTEDKTEMDMRFTPRGGSQARKWMPLVFVSIGALCFVVGLVIGLHLNRSSSGPEPISHQATAEKMFEERDRLKQTLQNLNNHTSQGWIYFGGSFYLGSSTGQNWNQSRKLCQQKGADLIIINSRQEQEFARVMFAERRWMGLSELEQVWRWVDGSPLNTSVSFWFPGEPNNQVKGEDCAELNFREGIQNWNDVPCSLKFKYICEKPADL